MSLGKKGHDAEERKAEGFAVKHARFWRSGERKYRDTVDTEAGFPFYSAGFLTGGNRFCGGTCMTCLENIDVCMRQLQIVRVQFVCL